MSVIIQFENQRISKLNGENNVYLAVNLCHRAVLLDAHSACGVRNAYALGQTIVSLESNVHANIETNTQKKL